MADCPTNIIEILPSDFLGDSLFKINTNYYNLDNTLCQLGKDLITLQAFITSLQAKDTPTIDLTFSVAGYFLSADVQDNSISTSKLGIDIPTTTKLFLTAAKVNSLIDVVINSTDIKPNHGLRWNGTNWVSSRLTDDFGAKIFSDLLDTVITNNVQNGEVVKYVSASGVWVNAPDACLSAVPDGDYADINVSGNGQIWNILPEKVTEIKLRTNAVQTVAFDSSQVINNKFANNTIQKVKFADDLGQINTAINVGTGTVGICLESNIQIDSDRSAVPFKSLKGEGGCTISSTNEEILITATQPPDPLPPTGSNLVGSGDNKNIFVGVTNTTNVFQFKTLIAGEGVNFDTTTNPNEILISKNTIPLGLTLLDLNTDNSFLTNTQIAAKLKLIFPPENFPAETYCNVVVETPSTLSTTNMPVSIPYTASYYYKPWAEDVYTNSIAGICGSGSCSVKTGTNYYMSFRWLDPVVGPSSGLIDPNTISSFPPPQPTLATSSGGHWAGYKNLTTTANISSEYQPKFALTTQATKVFRTNIARTIWELV